MLKVADYVHFSDGRLSFVGRGNIWVRNNFDSGSIGNLLRYLLLHALQDTAPNQLEVVCFDNTLSGSFAPFASFTSGEVKLLTVLHSEMDLEKYLFHLLDYIQMVQNTLQGMADSLLEYREMLQTPVESYKLVFLYVDFEMLDNRIRHLLSILMKRSVQAGITIVVVSYYEDEYYPNYFDSNIQKLEVSGNTVINLNTNSVYSFLPISVNHILGITEELATKCKKTAYPTVAFDSLHPSTNSGFWREKSTEGIRFYIGKNGSEITEIVIGDDVNQRHNILVTGAVGQGKSNLLSVIIHSICYHYSPDEVRLILLDYKEGVTLKPYSNLHKEDYLPHADVLALESDIEFGSAVLMHLYAEYKRRLKLFKKYDVQNIQNYREKTGFVLPRLVVIIDEFQLMFGDDTVQAAKIADMLEKSVRLFRAAGIHFILSSQSIGGISALIGKTTNIFGQVPIRLVHKNSLNESYQSLSLNNNAAVYLRPREAIVNLDYGEVSQNRKSVVAFADERILAPLRKEWWNLAKAKHSQPMTFEGERRYYYTDSEVKVSSCQGSIGKIVSVDDRAASLAFPSESGRNLLILGVPDQENNTALGMVLGLLQSLKDSTPDCKFIICDLTRNEYFYKKVNATVPNVIFIESNNLQDKVEEVLTTHSAGKLFIVGLGLDKWTYTKQFSASPPLRNLVENGPNAGIHFIGWWLKESKMKEHCIGFESNDIFNTKIFLRVDERVVQSQTSSFIHWQPQANRALLYDEIDYSGKQVIIPFSLEGE
ncbi:TPA: FtsK/SpoIIIE domain-containing protein, partial [Streptococcus suis]|nr:hypothetical protein [Streptococcus suis]HEL1811208.1 hypothetical protein [Streptococcus suis]